MYREVMAEPRSEGQKRALLWKQSSQSLVFSNEESRLTNARVPKWLYTGEADGIS